MARSDRPALSLPARLARGPKGAQLQAILEGYVATLPPGSLLPSERELAERFGLARMTVRAQVERLAQRRLVYRQQGRGTFVAEPMLTHTEHLTSFTEDMRARGLAPGTRLVEAATDVAIGALAARMELPEGSAVLRIRRVRTADGVPMAVEETHLPADRFPGLSGDDLAGGSLYDLITGRYGVTMSQATQRVTVVTLAPDDVALLETTPDEPAFRIERLTRDADGVLIEYAASLYRGDRYEVVMHARRDAAPDRRRRRR
ncbi:MAG: GntR family transcriptional regulator [Nocardioidaceae bacterium]